MDALDIPPWAWHRDDTRALLARRDVAALFRFAQHYAGASQSRIASLCGLGQGRVNEIINGRRDVTRLDVLTRIADGLGMPDEARTEFGLAPRFADRERVQVYPSQAHVTDEIRRAAKNAGRIDILAVRGLGIVGLNSSLLHASVTARPETRLRVLLLHPDSEAAARRAEEIGESAEQMASGIRVAEASLRKMADGGAQVQLYYYRTLAVWRLAAVDNTLYVSAFHEHWEGHESEITKLAASTKGALYNGFVRMLTELFRTGERVI